MASITHNNHYVPQLYLRQWSNDGHKIYAYRLLVSHSNVPEWNHHSISQVATLSDLYTEIDDGQEVDEFEKWLNSEFENPVQESLAKVLKAKPLTHLDWERLACFLGAQDVRTPSNYLKSTERWIDEMPSLLQSSLEETVRELEQGENPTVKNAELKDSQQSLDLKGILTVKTMIDEFNPEQAQVQAHIVIGRKLWLQEQRLVLTKTINALKEHKWCIVRPARGLDWFTSDHPVIKLNYYDPGNYDLKGGWNVKNGNLFMPLSPRHLFFTQIGADLPDSLTFSPAKTKEIQKLIAENALRWIFAHEPLKFVSRLRSRHVNAEAFKFEAAEWKNWHAKQQQANQ